MGEMYETIKKALNHDTREQLGDDHAEAQLALKTAEEERAIVNARYRVRINELKEKCRSLARQRVEGVLEEKIEIEEVHDDDRMMVEVLRKDTSQVLRARPMSPAEKEAAVKRRQGGLFDDKKKSKLNGKAASPTDFLPTLRETATTEPAPRDSIGPKPRGKGKRGKGKTRDEHDDA